MKIFSIFIAGMGYVLSFGWPSRMKYPFPFPAKAVNSDWINIGSDLTMAIKKLEEQKKLEEKNEA